MLKVLNIHYDIQLIYEELKEYNLIIPKYKIREIYFEFDQDIVSVIYYFVKNNILFCKE